MTGVTLEACPPFEDAEVFVPTNVTLTREEEGVIQIAVLAYYYDVEDLVFGPTCPVGWDRGAESSVAI